MRSRVGLTIVVIVVVVAIVVVIIGTRLSPGPPAVPGGISQQTTESAQPSLEQAVARLQDLTIEGAQVTQRDEATGEIIWQASAEGQFEYSENNEALRAEDIRWELTRPGQDSLIVEAPLFLASDPERKITFSEGVRAYTPDKSQLFEMSRLVYQTDTEKLLAEGGVRFRYGGYQATGNRLVIDNRAQQVRMSGGVHFARVSG